VSETEPPPSTNVAEAAPIEPAPAPAPAPSPIEAPVAPPAAEPSGPVAAARPTVQLPDTGSLAQFRQQLIGVAVRYKRYPRMALDNGWEGDVVVRIEIGAGGAVASVSVKSSSGHEVLDAQALDMFRKAVPQVPVPPALRGRDFSVDVRAIYSLKDQPSG
jgi:protein TonB